MLPSEDCIAPVNQKPVLSQDVADLADVSRTTVSLVLNNVEGVNISPATRQRVLDAADLLGYVPNATAQALATQRAQAIGLIMTRSPDHIASDNFLPQILGGLLTVIKKEKFRLLIEIVEEGEHDRAYIELAQAKHIDGMIILTPRTTDIGLKKLGEMNIPAVLFGYFPECTLPSVHVDDRKAAEKATQYLLGLGHRKIACILNAPYIYDTGKTRTLGYQDALKKAGIPFRESLVRYADFDPSSGYEAMRSLLDSGEQFSAVFVASDNVAMGAKSALQKANLSIPEDISVVGFDDIPWAAYATPPLTTVKVPAQKMASEACILLLDLIKGKKPEQREVVLDAELMIRQSCQPV